MITTGFDTLFRYPPKHDGYGGQVWSSIRVRRKEARGRSWQSRWKGERSTGKKRKEDRVREGRIGVRVWVWRWRWSRSKPISCNSSCCWPEALGGGRPWSSSRTPRHIPNSSPSPSFWPRNTSPRFNRYPLWFLASVATSVQSMFVVEDVCCGF